MIKVKGIHFYINVNNLQSIIKENEKKDEELKWVIHMLHTYFTGFTKLIKLYRGDIEKCNGGRAHVVFSIDANNETAGIENAIRAIVACFVYNNNIFNSIGKYRKYNRPDFKVSGGMDYGDYIFLEIDDKISEKEDSSIGATANNAAKIQTFADTDYIYVLDRLYDSMPQALKDKFQKIDSAEQSEINEKIPTATVYCAKYSSVYDDIVNQEIEEELKDVTEKVDKEAQKLNISEIEFSEAKKVLIKFPELSINNNKKFVGGVLCADLRGFTHLFNNNDSNVKDLAYIMDKVYEIMGKVVNEEYGARMQYQGDRIVAVFHDYTGTDPYIIRMLRCAMKINEQLPGLNNDKNISSKLGGSEIAVGIGCSIGNIIASRLGLVGNRDNIVLSEAAKDADKCEDKYAEEVNTIAINKELHDAIVEASNNTLNLEYIVFDNIFEAISKTSYYKTTADYKLFLAKLKEEKEKEKKVKEARDANQYSNKNGDSVNVITKPWGLR